MLGFADVAASGCCDAAVNGQTTMAANKSSPREKRTIAKKSTVTQLNVVIIQSSVVKLWERVTAAIGCGYRRLVDGRIVGFAGTLPNVSG